MMDTYCVKCKSVIDEDDIFCNRCGASQTPPPQIQKEQILVKKNDEWDWNDLIKLGSKMIGMCILIVISFMFPIIIYSLVFLNPSLLRIIPLLGGLIMSFILFAWGLGGLVTNIGDGIMRRKN